MAYLNPIYLLVICTGALNKQTNQKDGYNICQSLVCVCLSNFAVLQTQQYLHRCRMTVDSQIQGPYVALTTAILSAGAALLGTMAMFGGGGWHYMHACLTTIWQMV